MVTSNGPAPGSGSDALVDGVDREALRFHAFCADRLLTQLEPAAGVRLLDVCTGSGTLAVGAAQAIGPDGRVTAIDPSEHWLERLENKIRQFGIANIDVHSMRGARLDFRRDYFDVVLCSLGMHWFADLPGALREWQRVLRPGGRLGCVSLATGTFQPQLGLLQQRLATAASMPPLPWAGTSNPATLEALLRNAGWVDVELVECRFGYHLAAAEQWWQVVEHSALSTWLQPLEPGERRLLQAAHLAEVAPLLTENGLWLDVPVVMALARKP